MIKPNRITVSDTKLNQIPHDATFCCHKRCAYGEALSVLNRLWSSAESYHWQCELPNTEVGIECVAAALGFGTTQIDFFTADKGELMPSLRYFLNYQECQCVPKTVLLTDLPGGFWAVWGGAKVADTGKRYGAYRFMSDRVHLLHEYRLSTDMKDGGFLISADYLECSSSVIRAEKSGERWIITVSSLHECGGEYLTTLGEALEGFNPDKGEMSYNFIGNASHQARKSHRSYGARAIEDFEE